MASRVAARRDEDVAPVLRALDLALENSRLGRVAFVVGGVDGEERRADPLQARRRVVVVRGFPLVQDVVGVAAEGLREPLRDDRVGLLARGRPLVERP
jgi:xanthine dehydrogenase iron-sulfur cluster and FAD-binding subunit A